MQRELNPELFGSSNAGSGSDNLPSSVDFIGQNHSLRTERQAILAATELRGLDADIRSTKLQMQSIERKLEHLCEQYIEANKNTNARFDRMNQSIARLEDVQAHNNQEVTSKFVSLLSRVNERKLVDKKIEEMMERHNTIVRNFENRLTHLHRIISEQEIKLHNYAATLEEARMELTRLRARSGNS